MSKPRNYYDQAEVVKFHNPNYHEHGLQVPFRMLVIAASGGGKTNFLCELLHMTRGTFEEIIICLRDKGEPLYDLIGKKCKDKAIFFENSIPEISDYKKDKKQRLIVFDDLILSAGLQKKIGEYYIRSRKYNISCCYLSQSFYAVPKIIRLQTGYVIIKKITSVKDLKMIIREYSLGLDLDQLINMYNEIVGTGTLEFLLIDIVDASKKYRRNFLPLDIKETI